MDGIVAIVVSILCVFVVVIMSLVVLYQTSKAKEQMAHNMQDLVDQVNDSATYSYKFDINQEENIKNMDKNITMLGDDVKVLQGNVKIIQENIQASPRQYTENIKTGMLTLSDRFSLTALPAPNRSLNEDWVRLSNKQGTDLQGGLAVSRLYVDNVGTINTLDVQKGIRVAGGASRYNPENKPSMLPDIDNVNRLRGDTEISGTLSTQGSLCINNTCINENDLRVLIGSNRPMFRFPPSLTSASTTIKGIVYNVNASSFNANNTPWSVFNGGHWQSANNKYTILGDAITSPKLPTGYSDNHGGEWISLQVPYSVYLRRYDIGGDVLSFVLYGMSENAWSILDKRTLHYSPHNEIMSFTLVPPGSKPMNHFVLKIQRTSSNTGMCTLSHLSFYGSI
jgi:hypothetical protein